MKTVSIVGFGRFGKVLYRLLKDDFEITVFQRKPFSQDDTSFLDENSKIAENLPDVYKSEIVFFAIPISSFRSVLKEHKKFFQDNHLLIDVLSVKVHPQKLFKHMLRNKKTRFLLTHPMFGPDSSKNGFSGLPLILSKGSQTPDEYDFWKNYFSEKGISVVELSAEEHDKMAANSQGLTHFIGRLLEQLNIQNTLIDSVGAKKLLEIKEQTCNDTWQLFTDLQQYNPYTKQMRIQLGFVYDKLYGKLLPKQINRRFTTFGIQGGKGSFNEVAIQDYITRHHIGPFKIKYLYTSEKVLRNLHEGNIDFGLFAIQNATGGIVEESVRAMARYKFKIVEEFAIIVRHFLMKKKTVPFDNIKTIMAHDQVFRQCKETLAKKYPHLKQTSGEGDLIDTAKAAQYLAAGKLPDTTAILGPEILSKLYDLEIIDENLQDKQDNLTSFLLVER